MKCPFQPDQGLCLLVERLAGADIHKVNNLLHNYKLACHLGKREIAEQVAEKLRKLLLARATPARPPATHS